MNCSDQIITYASYDDYGRNGPHDKYWHCFASSYVPGKETLGTCRLFPFSSFWIGRITLSGRQSIMMADRKVRREQQAVDTVKSHGMSLRSTRRSTSSAAGCGRGHPRSCCEAGAAFTFAAALGRGCA
jgi:hypothetical protein